MIDYEILKAIWWLFIGVLLVGFTIMDGQDMGVGTLLPFLGKNDSERRIMINSVAPHWDGNQVWFVTGGYVCCLAVNVRHRVLGFLLGHARNPCSADVPPVGF